MTKFFFLVLDLALVRAGFARMSAVMASSKLNGWSETGFAFGIGPPMANVVAHSSLRTSSEPALPVANSAVCYDCIKDVSILAVVMSERDLARYSGK